MDLVSTDGEAILDEGGDWPANKHGKADLEDRAVENIKKSILGYLFRFL